MPPLSAQQTQVYSSAGSPFYKSRFPRRPVYDKSNYGAAIFGPYQQKWDPANRQWVRPDGSRAALAGFGGFGDTTTSTDLNLPTLDLSSTPAKLLTPQALVGLAATLALGLGAGYALQHHQKYVGFGLIGLGAIAAVFSAIQLTQSAQAVSAANAWAAVPATATSTQTSTAA